MRPALPLLLALLGCAPTSPGDVAPEPAGPPLVRVVTWNVHDLFDAVPATAPLEAKLDALAAVLLRLDADVVLLQEVETLPLLGRLAERTGHGEARLAPGNDPRGLGVGLLSRWPVAAWTSHAGELGPDGERLWPRDAAVAEVAVGRAGLVLVGTHLSSHLSDPDGARRLLQAARLRELGDEARARHPAALVLVGGDLNDGPDAAALAPLLADGAWRDPDAALHAAGGATWSDGRSASALDHLLAPAAQGARLVAWRVEAGGDVAAASDHRPVVLDVDP